MSPLSSLFVVAGCLLSAVPCMSIAADLPSETVSQQARLEVPELIQVLAIDGQERTGNFFGSRATTLELNAGEHVLSVRYSQIFQLGADDHDIIKSKPMAIRFNAEAGQRYALTVSPPKRYEAAKEFAKQPDIRLINTATGNSQQATLISSYAEASLVDSIGKAFQNVNEESKTSNNLQLLQDIWLRASPSERQSFAAWLASKAATAK